MATGKPPWKEKFHNLDNPLAIIYHIASTVEVPPAPPSLSPEGSPVAAA